jgi:hypothetical protein
VAGPLAAQVPGGASAQLLVDEGHQPLGGSGVAVAPGQEEGGDLSRRRLRRALRVHDTV